MFSLHFYPYETLALKPKVMEIFIANLNRYVLLLYLVIQTRLISYRGKSLVVPAPPPILPTRAVLLVSTDRERAINTYTKCACYQIAPVLPMNWR